MADLVQEVEVVNALGIHARPAAMLVQRMLAFESNVFITFNGNRVNAKSIMGLLTLAASRGSVLTLECTGADSAEAMQAAIDVFESGFGEE